MSRKGTETPARTDSGQCLHCGEPTKGGLFLPGHDAAYLAAIVKNIKGEDGVAHTLDEWLAKMAQFGCSQALQDKLTKRVH